MKALFVASVENHILSFHLPYIQFFIDNGYEVHVAAKISGDCEELTRMGVICHQVDFSRSPYSFDNIKAFRQLKILMKSNHYSIVHTHTPMASFITRLAARITDTKPVIYTAHGFHFYTGAPILNWLVYYPVEWIAARFTDCLITINQEDYRRAAKFKLRKEGQVFFVNGVGVNTSAYDLHDVELRIKYRQELGIDHNAFVLICVGELNTNKNQMQLIKAVQEARSTKIMLLLVGVGETEESIKNYLDAQNMNHMVKLLGHRKDIPELLNASDCVALVSLREGLPRCLLEGMAAGLPAITTNVRGCRDLVVDGENGFVVEVGDIDATVKAIRELMVGEEEYRQLRESSRRMVEAYSLVNVRRHMEGIYSQYIKCRKT